MVEVRPLRGVRFDTQHSGPVGPLIAPPYDVVGEPANGAEFSIRKIEGVELGAGNDHAWAAERYEHWLERGILRPDPVPMIYVHRHQFMVNGVLQERTGLMARVRLSDWSERIVLPHELTTSGPKHERLARLRAVQANLSPLYFLFRDPDGEIRNLIHSQAQNGLELDERDQMGGSHGLRPIANTTFQARLTNAFARRKLFVADGHHRYEAALSYRDERRAITGGGLEAPSEFVLALLAAVEDPGVIVRPTHRLIVGERMIDPSSALDLLHQWFDVQRVSIAAPMPKDRFICRVALPEDFGVWDLYGKSGNPHQTLLPGDRGSAWRSLGVAAVEAIVERILGDNHRASAQRVVPAIDDMDAINQVMNGRAQVAFLLPAPNLDQLLEVAEEGDLLPAKSTWFEPKAPAGLVINDLRY